MRYTDLGLLDQFDQNPLGDLTYTGGTTPSGTTKRVGYTYDEKKRSTGNWIRPTATAYPSGDSLAVAYGTSSSTTSSRISRPTKLGAGFAFTAAAVDYLFLGVATPVITHYPGPGIKLDRALAQNGAKSDGQYPGVDSFGRVIRQLWVDDGYAAGSVTGFADRPAIVDSTYAYSRLSALTGKLDARPGATMLANHAYTLDGILRLLEDQRGTAGFPSGGAKPGSQQFTYDFIGNLPQTKTDTSDAGSFSTGGTGTTALSGSAFSLANQITGGTYTPPLSTTAQTMSFTWDAAGNLGARSIAGDTSHSWQYKHDRWGRLTQADFMDGTTAQPALRAQYDALGMRCVVDRAPDTWVPPAAPSITERRLGYFDASWELLEEHIDHDYPLATAVSDIDEVDQLVWGLRHIDDLVLRRVNANYSGGSDTDYTDTGDRVGDQYLSDTQFSVVASVASTGALLERVEYDAYGQAQHHFAASVAGGADVSSADEAKANDAIDKSIGQTGYNSDADINRNGTVNSTDIGIIHAAVPTSALSTGRISTYGNAVGWCGYQLNAGPNIYTVRFRHYDPTAGVTRWLERDPAGYMDGASLYAYGGMSPALGTDSLGLSLDPPGWSLRPSAVYLRNRLSDGSLISDYYWRYKTNDRGQGGQHVGPRSGVSYMDEQLAQQQQLEYERLQNLAELAGAMREIGEAAQDSIGIVIPGVGIVQDAAEGNYLGVGLAVVPLGGQLHHVFSVKVFRAMQEHKVLKGLFKRNDRKWITRAVDGAAHRGYQTWHRELDDDIVLWLGQNTDATQEGFERYLQELYSRPDIKRRFPNGPCGGP